MDSALLDELLDGEGAMLLEPRDVFDPCVVGIAERVNLRVAAYDAARVIQALVDGHGMDEDEAEDYFQFNIAGAYVGNGSPVFLYLFDDE